MRPYIPDVYHMKIFHQMHYVCHSGIKSSTNLVMSKFICPIIGKDVQCWIQSCMACQKSKINPHIKSKFGDFLLPSEIFSEVHIDLVGPLPPSNENMYIFCIFLANARCYYKSINEDNKTTCQTTSRLGETY